MDPSFLFIILLAHFIGLPPFSGAGFCPKYTSLNVTQCCDGQNFNSSELYFDTFKASTRRQRCYCHFTSERNTTTTLSTKDYPSHTTTSCKTTSRIEYRIIHVPGTSGIICGYTVKQIDIRRGQSLSVTFYNELANLENYCLNIKTTTAAHKLHGKCFADSFAAADTSTNPTTTSKQSTTKQRQEEAYTSGRINHQGKDATTKGDSTTSVTTTGVTSPSVTTTDVTSPGDTTTSGASKGYTTRDSTYTVGITSGTLTGHTTSSASPGGTSRIGTTTGDATTIGTTTSVNVLQGTSSKHVGVPLPILLPLVFGWLFFIIVVAIGVIYFIRRNKREDQTVQSKHIARAGDEDEANHTEQALVNMEDEYTVIGENSGVSEQVRETNTDDIGEYSEVSPQSTVVVTANNSSDCNEDDGYLMPHDIKMKDSEPGSVYVTLDNDNENGKEQDYTSLKPGSVYTTLNKERNDQQEYTTMAFGKGRKRQHRREPTKNNTKTQHAV